MKKSTEEIIAVLFILMALFMIYVLPMCILAWIIITVAKMYFGVM